MSRHLAIFLPSLDSGGAEKVMLALAGRFAARGVRCDLVIAMNQGPLIDCIPAGVRLISLSKHKTLNAAFGLARYLRREQPQTLLSTIFAANITALVSVMLTRPALRVVLREANQTELDIRGKNRTQTWLNHLLASLLYRRADAVIAVAESVCDGLKKARLVPASRISTIHNPASPSTTSNESHGSAAYRTLILACGRLEPQKDHATLLRAFAKVRAHRDAMLVIVGEGSLRPKLQELAMNLGISEAVTFTGFDPDPSQWMRKAAVLVHPSNFEGMSNVLLEALASGCPIVATDCPGGTREILADGKFGTLVPVGDDEAIANAIMQVLKGEVHFPDTSQHLRQFDIEMVADAYLSVLFPQDRKAI